MCKKVLLFVICFIFLMTTICVFCPETAAAQKLATQTGFKLPDGFPGDIPFADDAYGIGGQRNDTGKEISVNYKSDKKFMDIAAMYKAFIGKKNDSFKEEKDSSSVMYTSSFDDYDIQVIILNMSPATVVVNLLFHGNLPDKPVYSATPATSETISPVAANQGRLKLPAFIPKEIPFAKDAVLSSTIDNSFAPAGKQNMVITYKTKLAYNSIVNIYKTFAGNGTKENSVVNQGNTYLSICKFNDYELQICVEQGLVRLNITPNEGVFRNHYDKTDYSDGITDKSGITNSNLQTPKRLMAGPRHSDPMFTNLFVKKTDNTLYGRGFELYLGAKQDESGRWGKDTVNCEWTFLDSNAYCLDTEVNNYYLLKPDGSLWTYGNNGDYLLGNGEVVDSNDYPPTRILENVRSADIGSNGIAVKKDGSLWIWGKSSPLFSVLEKPEEDRPEPVKIMDNVVDAVQSGSVSNSSGSTIMVLKTDGSLWTWGRGNCGDGGLTFERKKPIKIMNGVKAIEASFGLCCVIKKDDSLWVWQSHETGAGYLPNIRKPVKILTDVKMVSPGLNFLAALKKDGTAWTYGDNYYGECGIGNTSTKYLSAPRKILSGVTEISASYYNAFALMNNGKIMGWGKDSQNGDIFDWLKLSDGKIVVAKPMDIGFGIN